MASNQPGTSDPQSGTLADHYPAHVLLVDDQAMVGEVLRRMLISEPNVNFHYCSNPEEAVATARQLKPTVILQDLVMPGVDGLDLVRQYRADPATRDIPIIVLSTNEEPATKGAAFGAGANDYVVKLPDKIELIARIQYHSRSYLNQVQRNDAYRMLRESETRLSDRNFEIEVVNKGLARELHFRKQKNAEQFALAAFSVAALSSENISETLRLAASTARDVVRAEVGAIIEVDVANDLVTIVTDREGSDPVILRKLGDYPEVSIIQLILAKKNVERFSNIKREVLVNLADIWAGDVKSGLFVPISFTEGTLGIIVVASFEERQFSADEEGFLQGFANTLNVFHARGKTLERLRLHDRALQNKNQQLAEADRAKDRFLAMMSHELRTPLTGVLGMADLLLATGLTDEQAEFTRTLSRSAHVLLTLLNDILDFSKIESGRLQIEHAPFLLSEILNDVKSLYTGTATEKGLVLQVNTSPDLQDSVIGDITRLRQVLSNLISNALKFTSDGGVTIDVDQETREDGGLILRVAVSDTGVGIPEDKIGLLFQPFVQADASITRKFGGTGLGLTICRSLVRAMGGEIEIESAHGKGSTFKFFIRLEPELAGIALAQSKSGDAAAAAIAETEGRGTRSLNVLLAEDNPTTRMLISTMLERKGHVVTEVENGALAVAAIRDAGFDIILMDMQMPVMDGPEAVREIRKLEHDEKRIHRTPIIALTADIRIEGRDIYRQAGADSVLSKPVDWNPLFTEMQRLSASEAEGSAEADRDERVAQEYSAEDDKVVNEAALASLRTQIGDEKVNELLAAFVDGLVKYGEDLTHALAADDLHEAKRIAHAIKGVAGTFGALQTGLRAAVMEDDVHNLEGAALALPVLLSSINEVRALIARRYGIGTPA